MSRVLEPHRTTPDRSLVSKLAARLGAGYRRSWWPIHAKLGDVQRKMPRAAFDAYFKFGFVRNPFSWLVSRYHFVRSSPVHNRHPMAQNMSFAEYVEFETRRLRGREQHRFLADGAGDVGVDFVGRFEKLGEDFATVCERLEIDAELPHINKSEHGAYRAYFDDATRALVERHWRQDLERFEYAF